MSVQVSANITNRPFILNGEGVSKDTETVLQDAVRSGAMVRYTLMSYNPTSKKWVPFTDETATDGTQIPTGILLASLTEAEIQAGDVVDVPILVGRMLTVDRDQLVIENSKTLDTIVNVPTNLNKSVEELLRWTGIFMGYTIPVEDFENA
jgi:hypothetical protein